MSKEPPKDQDPILSEILKQLEQAFLGEGESNIDILQELTSDVAESWSQLSETGPAFMEHQMTVLEGGKSDTVSQENTGDDFNPERPPRPTLELLDEPQEESTSSPFSNIEVHVLKPEDLFRFYSGKTQSQAAERFLTKGRILLKGDDSQQIAVLKSNKVYRLTCENGNLDVQFDGNIVRIHQGQSLDVEGCHIEVTSSIESTGFFEFLDAHRNKEVEE